MTDDANVMLNGFGTVVNSLQMRAKPYLPQFCGIIKWRLNNKNAKLRQQAADLIARIAIVMKVTFSFSFILPSEFFMSFTRLVFVPTILPTHRRDFQLLPPSDLRVSYQVVGVAQCDYWTKAVSHNRSKLVGLRLASNMYEILLPLCRPVMRRSC